MKKIEAFIFDLDGTLVDSLPDIQANLNRALAACGHPLRLSLEAVRPHVGGGAQKLAAAALDLPLEDPRVLRLYHAFEETYAEHPAELSRPFPGVVDTLKALKARGFPLGCVTAKPAKARKAVLEALNLASYFTCDLSPEDGYANKPAPDMLLACCRAMEVEPGATVMVGDTRFDMEAGFNAGCARVCYCEHGYQPLPPEFEGKVVRLREFSELLDLL